LAKTGADAAKHRRDRERLLIFRGLLASKLRGSNAQHENPLCHAQSIFSA